MIIFVNKPRKHAFELGAPPHFELRENHGQICGIRYSERGWSPIANFRVKIICAIVEAYRTIKIDEGGWKHG